MNELEAAINREEHWPGGWRPMRDDGLVVFRWATHDYYAVRFGYNGLFVEVVLLPVLGVQNNIRMAKAQLDLADKNCMWTELPE